MYLLCAKTPNGPPMTPSQSTLSRKKIEALPPDTKITTLRNDVAKLLEMESESFHLLYCGRVLDDEKTMESYNIKATSSIHVIPKPPKPTNEDAEEKKTLTDDEVQHFMFAFGMAVKSSEFNRVAQGLAKRENLESLIAANPSLAKDPIACAFVSKPELLLSLLDPETYKYVYEHHPGLADAAYQLAATVHEEKPNPYAANVNDVLGSANPFADHQDEMTDDEEDEDMDLGVAEGATGDPINNLTSAITAESLAEALSNIRNQVGGMTAMGLTGGGVGAQSSSTNPGTSNSGQLDGMLVPSNSHTGESSGTSATNTKSHGITRDQLARALAALPNFINPPASSTSNQTIGSDQSSTDPN